MNRKELKEKIKSLSSQITALRKTRKTALYGFVPGLLDKSYEARHHHVAASLLRGRTIEQIEPNCKSYLDKGYVRRIMDDVILQEETERKAKEVQGEVVCDCEG